MMVPSAKMFGMTSYTPVYTSPTPISAVATPPVIPSLLPNAEVELKQVILYLYYKYYTSI